MYVQRFLAVAEVLWPLLALAIAVLTGCHPPGHH